METCIIYVQTFTYVIAVRKSILCVYVATGPLSVLHNEIVDESVFVALSDKG